MAESRVTSVLTEVLSGGGQGQARVSSVVVEVLLAVGLRDRGQVPVSTGTAVIVCVVSS